MSHGEEVDATFATPPAAVAERLNDVVEGDKNGVPVKATAEEREGSASESSEDTKEYYCGCGPWHPAQLQVFRDARVFTFLLCLFATIEGALVSGTPYLQSYCSCSCTLTCNCMGSAVLLKTAVC